MGSIPTEVKIFFSLPRVVPCFPLLGLTPSGLFMGLSTTLICTSELILCSTICVHMRGRAGPVTEISVFATEVSVTGKKIFPYENSSPGTGTKLFKQNSFALTTFGPTKWHSFDLVCSSTLEVCELALLVKLQGSRKLWKLRTIQIYVPPFWSCFLNSSRSTGLKFPIWTP